MQRPSCPRSIAASPRRTARISRTMLLALAAASAGHAYAATDNWTGNAGGTNSYWETAANWSLGHAPTTTDDIQIATSFTNGTTLYYNNNHTIDALFIITTSAFDLGNGGGSTTGITLTSGFFYQYGVTTSARQEVQTITLSGTDGIFSLNGTNVVYVDYLQQTSAARGFDKNGIGTLSLASVQTTGAATVSSGVLQYDASAGYISVSNTTVFANATLQTMADLDSPVSIQGTGVNNVGAWRISVDSSLVDQFTQALSFTSTVSLAAAATINVEFNAVFSGALTDGGNHYTLTKTGAATLTLGGTGNTFSGTLSVTNGTLELFTTAAQPAGSISISGGALAVDANATLSCPVSLSGTGYLGGGTIQSVGNGGGIIAGNVTLLTNATISGTETISGPIADGASTFSVTIPIGANPTFSGTNTYKGGTFSHARLTAASSGAFGTGSVSLLQFSQTFLTGNITLPNNFLITGSNSSQGDLVVLANNPVLNGNIALTASNIIRLDVNPATTLTLNGIISDGAFTGGLSIIDTGTLILGGSATSTFKGGLQVNHGELNIRNPHALGTGAVTVNNPATGGTDNAAAELQGNITITNPLLAYGGNGTNSLGVLRSISGNNSWTGGITLNTTNGNTTAIGVDANSILTVTTGSVTGAGALAKVSPGRLVLNSTVSIPAINILQGAVQFTNSAASPVATTVTVANGAAAEVNDPLSTNIILHSNFSIAGNGIGSTGAIRATGSVSFGSIYGNIHLAGNASIGVDANNALYLQNNALIDDGSQGFSLTKLGAGTLVLTNLTATYSGGLNINGGTLQTYSDAYLGAPGSPVTINNSATLQFPFGGTTSRTINANNGTILVDAGYGLTYSNTTVSGGFLSGAGTHFFGVNSTFAGTTLVNGALANQNGASTLTNFTNAGTLNNLAPLTWSLGSNAPSGILDVISSAAISRFTNSGVINISPGATLTNSAANLFLAGGSRTYIGTSANHGGTLTLTGITTLEVNGALLVNDGTITGTTDVNYGGTAEGVGSYGTVNVTFGGTFQPGFASSGIINNGATITALNGNGTIDNTSAGTMTLTLTGSSSSTFSGPIQNTSGTTSLAVTGTTSLTLLTTPLANGSQSTNTFTGGLSIANGASVTIGAINALPNASTISNNGSLSINANSTASILSGLGSLILGPNASLTLATSSGGSKQGSLSLTPTSTLNLSNNQFVLEAPDSPTKNIDLSQISALIASGKSTGFGITSSALGANLAMAVIDNATLLTPFTHFGGQPVDANSILIAPELLGDANIDGHVDLNDLNTVLNNLGRTTGAWNNGNFDGASTIDLNDLNAVLNHLGLTYANSSNTIAEPLTPAATPEPASLALLALTLPLFLKRRPAHSRPSPPSK